MDTNLSSAEDIQERQSLPRTVYLALWFPLLSETFVFYEVEGLWKRKFPVSVVSLYGERSRFLAEHMRRSTIPVRHLGIHLGSLKDRRHMIHQFSMFEEQPATNSIDDVLEQLNARMPGAHLIRASDAGDKSKSG